MKRTILSLMGALALVVSLLGVATAEDGDHKEVICHPVGGGGSTGVGYSTVNVDKHSSHFDDEGNPKHEAEGRVDTYSVNGLCPGQEPDTEEPEVKEATFTRTFTRATCEEGQTLTVTLVNATFGGVFTHITKVGGVENGPETATADEGYAFPDGEETAIFHFDGLAGPLTGSQCEDPEPTDCERYEALIEAGALVRPTAELLEKCGPSVEEPEVTDPVVEEHTIVRPDKTVKVRTHASGKVTRSTTPYDTESADWQEEGM